MHGVENVLMLDTDGQRHFLSESVQRVAQYGKLRRAALHVHKHDHGKVFVHDRLTDVEHIHAVFRKQRGDARNDPHAVVSYDGYNGFFHIVSSAIWLCFVSIPQKRLLVERFFVSIVKDRGTVSNASCSGASADSRSSFEIGKGAASLPMTILDRDRAGLPVSIDEPEYPVINEIIARAHRICAGMNTGYCPPDRVRSLFAELTETEPDETLRICPPLHVGFGKNLRVGKNVFFNTGCTIMDRSGVTIGDDTFLGPNVSLITTNHAVGTAFDHIQAHRPRQKRLDRRGRDRPARRDDRGQQRRRRRRGRNAQHPGKYRCGGQPRARSPLAVTRFPF